MKAYFTNLPMKTWMLLIVPALAIAYPIGRIIVVAVVREIVPQVVRSVFSMM
jgi:hypothetical protein